MSPLKHRLFLATFVLGVALAVASGCGSGSGDAPASNTTTAPVDPPASKPSTTPSTTASTGAADGSDLFAKNCSGCHGDKGAGKRAPVLAGKHLAEADVTKIVTDGKGRMPAFKTRLKTDEVASIAKYVSTL